MPSLPITNKNLFSDRLRFALQRQGMRLSPSLLASEFNFYCRDEPITIKTARKWLMGLSVPTPDEIKILSKILNVYCEWLQWGGPLMKEYDPTNNIKNKIVSKINKLSPEELFVVEALIVALHDSKQMSTLMQLSREIEKMEARAGVEPTYTDLQSGA